MIGKNRNKHVSRNLANEAQVGFKEIANNVEHVIGQQMRELATGSIAGIGNPQNYAKPNPNTQLVQNTTVRVPELGGSITSGEVLDCDVMSSNIIEKTLSINVRRTGYVTEIDLPFVLFSPISQIDGYESVLRAAGVFPEDATLAVSIFQKKYLRFAWTTADGTDYIDISASGPTPYPSVMEMLKTDFFMAKGFKVTAGSNYDAQFAAYDLIFGQQTMFQSIRTETTPLSAYKTALQNQDNMINADISVAINGRRFLVNGMTGTPPAAQTVTTVKFDFYVTRYGSSTAGANC